MSEELQQKCSNSTGVWARTFARSKSNINGVQRLLIDLVLICVRNFLRVKVFPGPICMTSKDGSHSIQAKLKLSTRLVDNYRKWMMPIPLYQRYCFMFLGDTKQSLFPNALQ